MKRRTTAAVILAAMALSLTACQNASESEDLGTLEVKNEVNKKAVINLPDEDSVYDWVFAYSGDKVIDITDRGPDKGEDGVNQEIFVIESKSPGTARIEFDFSAKSSKGDILIKESKYVNVTVGDDLTLTYEMNDVPIQSQESTFYFDSAERTEELAKINALKYQADGYIEGSYMYDTGLQSITYYSITGSYILYTSGTELTLASDMGLSLEDLEIEGVEVKRGSDNGYYVGEWKEGSAYYSLAYIGNKPDTFKSLLVGAVDASIGLNESSAPVTDVIEGHKED